MNQAAFADMVDLLSAYSVQRDDRIALIEAALYGSDARSMIVYDGSAQSFSVQLVLQLLQYDAQNPDENTLTRVLEELRNNIGLGRQRERLDALIQESRQFTLDALVKPESLYVVNAPQDAVFAKQLLRDLSERGVSVLDRSLGLKLTNVGQHDWGEIFSSAVLPRIHTVVVLVSPNARTARPLRDELNLAKQQGKSIFALWIDGEAWDGTVPQDYETLEYVDARGSAAYEPALKALTKELGISVIAPVATLPPDYQPDASPYQGLKSFEREDWEYFFGRAELIQTLVKNVNALDDDRFLAVTGASGSGKSSLIKAGLLPKLEQGAIDGSETWVYMPPFTPSIDPFERLATALSQLISTESISEIKDGLRESKERLNSYAQRLALKADQRVVIYVDQFEELFTLTPDEYRRQFIDLIVHTATVKNGPSIIVITLRVDLLGQAWHFDTLMNLFKQHECRVQMIDQTDDLRDVIMRPAQLKHMQVEPDLVSELIADVRNQPGALPLLQFTLDELFRRREGLTLTLAAYERLGKLGGALNRHAESVYLDLSEPDRTLARLLFLRLIKPGAVEGEMTRVRIRRSELKFDDAAKTARIQQIADRFIDERLLMASGERDETIEISHEVLVRAWATLNGWQQSQRDQLQVQQEIRLKLERQTQRRQAERPFDDLLYKGQQLDDIEIWAVENANAEEAEFIKLSREAQNRQRAQEEERLQLLAQAEQRSVIAQQTAQKAEQDAVHQKARARRWLQITAAAGAVVVVLVILSTLSLQNLSAAETSRMAAEAETTRASQSLLDISTQAAAAATAVRDAENRGQALIRSSEALASFNQGQYSRALQQALEAVAMPNTPDSAYRILAQVAYSPLVPRRMFGTPNGRGSDAVYLDSSDQILSIDWDGRMSRWTLDGEVETFQVDADAISAFQLTPDGQSVVIGNASGQVIVWNLATNMPTAIFPVAETSINQIAFTPDGQAVIALQSGALELWDIERQAPIHAFEGHSDEVFDVVVLAEQGQMASASADGTVKIWNLASGELLQTLSGHTDYVTGLAVDATGTRLVSASLDTTLILWDATTGQAIATFNGHGAGVHGLALSPNGRLLISGDTSGVLKVWDTRSGYELSSVQAHFEPIMEVTVHPNGHEVLTISYYGRIFEWDTLPGNVMEFYSSDSPVIWHEDSLITSVCEAECSSMQIIRIAPDASVLSLGIVENDIIYSLALSGQSERLWIGTGSGRILLWDISQGRLVVQLDGHESPVIALEERGNRLMSVASTGVFLWNTMDNGLDRAFEDSEGLIANAALSPDGATVIIGALTSCGTLNLPQGCPTEFSIRETDSGEIVHQWTGDAERLSMVAFLPDGERVISTSYDNRSPTMWDITSGTPLLVLTGHSNPVSTFTISEDGHSLLSASCSNNCTRGEIIEWDLTTGEARRIFEGHADVITSLQYNADGTQFASTSSDGSLHVWRHDDNGALLNWIEQDYNDLALSGEYISLVIR